MILQDIQDILKATVMTREQDCMQEVESAFCSDMMSNVLAYAGSRSVLITGLYNPQVLRTAEMMGMACVVFIGRRDPDPDIVALADELEICLMRTRYSMFTACGLLYQAGLRGRVENEQ